MEFANSRRQQRALKTARCRLPQAIGYLFGEGRV